MINGLDILVAVKLHLSGDERLSYQAASKLLGVSPSQVHSSVKRLKDVRLIRQDMSVPSHRLLLALEALPLYMPSSLGQVSLGIPTAYSGPPLDQVIENSDLPVVWASSSGTARGHSLAPICNSVPFAAMQDPKLYECLCLIDALRIGNRREIGIAQRELSQIMKPKKLEIA